MHPLAPFVSVCIVAGHGTQALAACLASLRDQQAPPPFEVLVADNGDTGDVEATVRELFADAHVLHTHGRLPGAARNPLVRAARGEFLLFLDDDVRAAPGLLAFLAQLAAEHPGAGVFGGPNVTPPGSSRFQFLQGAVLSSLMGAGPVRRRYGARHAQRADERWFTLCNLAFRRATMAEFPDDLLCAEENAVLAELEARGEPMIYDPQLFVFHDRRVDWASFGRQMHKYGRGRGELLVREPRTVRAAFLAPSALLVYGAGLLPALRVARRRALLAGPGILYGAAVAANSAIVSVTLRRASAFPAAAALIGLLHLTYGAGVLRGIGRGLSRREPVAAPGAQRVAGRWATAEPAADALQPATSR